MSTAISSMEDWQLPNGNSLYSSNWSLSHESHITKCFNISISIRINPYSVLQRPEPLIPLWALHLTSYLCVNHTDPFVSPLSNTILQRCHTSGLRNDHLSVCTLSHQSPHPRSICSRGTFSAGFSSPLTESFISLQYTLSLVQPPNRASSGFFPLHTEALATRVLLGLGQSRKYLVKEEAA